MFEILSSWDIIIIAAYFGFTLIVAWWASGKNSKSQKDLASVDYFLAGKSEGWFVIGASLFSSPTTVLFFSPINLNSNTQHTAYNIPSVVISSYIFSNTVAGIVRGD